MPQPTATIHARVKPRLKKHAESVFRGFGLTTTEALTLFYREVEKSKKLPFAMEKPNALTRKTLRDSAKGKGLVRFASADEFLKDLGI